MSQVIDATRDGAIGTRDAAKFLGVSRTEVYATIARGELRSFKIGRRRLVLKADVLAFLAEKVGAAGPGSK